MWGGCGCRAVVGRTSGDLRLSNFELNESDTAKVSRRKILPPKKTNSFERVECSAFGYERMMQITRIKSLGCHQREFRCLLVLEVMEINVPWPGIYLVWYLGVSGLPWWQGEIYPLLCRFTASKGGFCHCFFFFSSSF